MIAGREGGRSALAGGLDEACGCGQPFDFSREPEIGYAPNTYQEPLAGNAALAGVQEALAT
jgi:hypothetical protein